MADLLKIKTLLRISMDGDRALSNFVLRKVE